MLDRPGTIWIDVSDLADWVGHLTGIQRVEYNLVQRFRRFEQVRYFVIQDGELSEADLVDIEYHIESEIRRGNNPIESNDAAPRDIADGTEPAPVQEDVDDQLADSDTGPDSAAFESAGSDGAASDSAPQRSFLRRTAKRTLGEVLDRAPFVSKERAVAAYDTVAHRAKTSVRQAGRTVRSGVRRPAEEHHESIRFARGDLVLVLGGNWGREGYLNRLGRELRRSDGIAFGHVIYDLIPAMSPGYFPQSLVDVFETYMDVVLSDATFCLAISEHSRSDALAYADRLGVPAPPIKTFRLGDELGTVSPRRPDGLEHDEPFIFCPGTIEVRKNHQLLYHVYRLAAERGLELPRLVIGGKRGWLAADVFHLLHHDPVVRDQISVLTSCRDSEFEWLYRNALFMVYPSAYEGWGLPVAESLNHEKLCLTSNASSLPEVGGDLVDYFSPDDSAQLLELIVRYSSDHDLLAKREAEVRANYRPASWDDAFNQVVAAIDELWAT